MDLLAFDAEDLYFDHADPPDVAALIKTAAADYAQGAAELPLLQAYLRAPESLNVLVALNRFYYYQHRLQESLLISQKALALLQQALNLPADWRELELGHISGAKPECLTKIRLYLFTLKSVGFLNMRLENLSLSQAIFEKLTAIDSMDRIGAKALLELVLQRQATAVI